MTHIHGRERTHGGLIQKYRICYLFKSEITQKDEGIIEKLGKIRKESC